jgi:hypothetical protein
MNEKIKELAKQAGVYQEQDADGTRFLAMPETCWEKFIELAVRDCMSLIWCELEESIAAPIVSNIADHFGVKP